MNVNCSILFCSYFQLQVIIFYLSVDELQDCSLVSYIIIVFLLSGFQKSISAFEVLNKCIVFLR